MNWADSAVLAAATLAAVNVIDSHLITKRLPSMGAFLVPVAVIALLWGTIALFVFPWPDKVEISSIGYAVSAGVIRTIGILMFLYAMQTEEVSRVIPVVNIHPVFVAVMAVPLLDESLDYLEWIAIFITVAGAVLISWRHSPASAARKFTLFMILPFLASLCLAGSNLTSKYALEDISFWNMYAVGSIALGAIPLMLFLRPSAIRALRDLNRPRFTLGLLTFNEILAPVGAVLLFWSIERGPVSLVSAIAAAQPVFVFAYAVVLSRISAGVILEERMSRGTIFRRFLAIAMIVGGVTVIHLT